MDFDNDKNYTNYTILVHQFGVFYTNYGQVKVGTGNSRKIHPLPIDWTGLLDERAKQPEPFLKAYSKEHLYQNNVRFSAGIPRGVQDSAAAVGTGIQPTPGSSTVLRINSVQVHEKNHDVPVPPPDIYTDLGKAQAPKDKPISVWQGEQDLPSWCLSLCPGMLST